MYSKFRESSAADLDLTLEKNRYECRINFFPPNMNVKFQLNGIGHKLFTYLAYLYSYAAKML